MKWGVTMKRCTGLAALVRNAAFRFLAYTTISGRQKTELPWQAVYIRGPAFAETHHEVLQSKGLKAQTSKVRWNANAGNGQLACAKHIKAAN